MIVPILALPLALQLVAMGDGIPNLNVRPSCEGAARAGYIATTEERLKSCIDTEQRTRDQLGKDWTNFPSADRVSCIASIAGFAPTYSELATCLEMKRDIKNTRPAEADSVPKATRTRARP
jgi:hypothetical protein